MGSREELEYLDAKRQVVNWRVIVLALSGVALALLENELSDSPPLPPSPTASTRKGDSLSDSRRLSREAMHLFSRFMFRRELARDGGSHTHHAQHGEAARH